jgi:hypothetical protein
MTFLENLRHDCRHVPPAWSNRWSASALVSIDRAARNSRRPHHNPMEAAADLRRADASGVML